MGDWRRLHSEEPHNLYASNIITLNISIKMRLAGYVARVVEIRNACKIGGKSEGRRHFGRPRCRWEDNIRMDLR